MEAQALANKTLDDYDRLFMTDGWKELTEDLNGKLAELKEMAIRGHPDNLKFIQGQFAAFSYITGLPQLVEQLRKMDTNDETDLL